MQSGASQQSENEGPGFGKIRIGEDRYSHIFQFFGLRQNPFHISPDPRNVLFTRQIQQAFDALIYGIQTRQGLLLLTGEVGTGKTTLTKYLLNWLRQQHTPTSFIFNARLNIGDLFDFILADFGISCQSKNDADKQARLVEWLSTGDRVGKTPVLLVDEAQGLPASVLAKIRLLLNVKTSRVKSLQIVLVGQPELEEKLRRPEFRELQQRIMVRCKIGPLNSAETRGYIQRQLRLAGSRDELVFQSDAIDAVHFYSRGIPRVINVLCEHSIITAYADRSRTVTPQIVNEVAHDFEFDKIEPAGARLNLSNTRPITSNSSQTIPAILPEKLVELSREALTQQVAISIDRAPAPENTFPGLSAPGASLIEKWKSIGTQAVASLLQMRSALTFSLSPKRSPKRWGALRDRAIQPNFSFLFRAVTRVGRWLQQPVRPMRARRDIDQDRAAKAQM